MTVEVSEDDIVRLQVLATAAGVGGPYARSFAELLSSTLHRGIIESYKTAELAGPEDPAGTDAVLESETPSPPATRPGRGARMRALRSVAWAAAAAATIVVIVGSYAGHWTWTGFTANGQVWDWMQLLLLPVAIGAFPLWLRFSGQMSRSAPQRAWRGRTRLHGVRSGRLPRTAAGQGSAVTPSGTG